ncbi:MAG: hypothetical protein HN380_31765 [Victivallales bacterium]|nr:hypothetical protein [Victivallales bacterium]
MAHGHNEPPATVDNQAARPLDNVRRPVVFVGNAMLGSDLYNAMVALR